MEGRERCSGSFACAMGDCPGASGVCFGDVVEPGLDCFADPRVVGPGLEIGGIKRLENT